MTKVIDFAIETLSEDMSTEEIINAWDDIAYAVSILTGAISNRLEKLGYDAEDYKDGDNQEIDQLLEVCSDIDTMNY